MSGARGRVSGALLLGNMLSETPAPPEARCSTTRVVSVMAGATLKPGRWTNTDYNHQWKTIATSTPGTSTAIGTGYTNTYTAMAGADHPAAELARNATYGGYDDWFLPSKGELNQMYIQRSVIGLSYYYWSSSEYDNNNTWYLEATTPQHMCLFRACNDA
jgi:hypothetical protein